MYPLIVKPRAVAMAREAYQWYEAQREGLGDLFLAALFNGHLDVVKWGHGR
jgi:hypothetical protein